VLVSFSLGALSIFLVIEPMAIMSRCKKLPCAKSANNGFDPFKRQEFDRYNAEAFYVAIKFGKSNR
jgi:hypothetical protein